MTQNDQSQLQIALVVLDDVINDRLEHANQLFEYTIIYICGFISKCISTDKNQLQSDHQVFQILFLEWMIVSIRLIRRRNTVN